MKKTGIIAFIIIACSVIVACGGSSSNDPKADSTSATDQSAVAQNSNAMQDTAGSIGTENKGGTGVNTSRAVELIAQSDCLTCHKVRDKLIGPSYEEVAKKYTMADTVKLADKIIKGGSGNFGAVPMTPHPSLSQKDAIEMAKYILSIK
jgi:cytochrome c